MTHKQREWARKHSWFHCSDSRAIWTKLDGQVIKFTSMKCLRDWAYKLEK